MRKSPPPPLNTPRPTDNCPICSTQEEKVTDQILKTIQHQTYAKNVVIFAQEQDSTGLFLIHKGRIKISRISSSGKEILIEILGPGKIIGEGGVFGSEKYSDTAMTAEETEVFFIPKHDFKRLLVDNPQLYQTILQCLVQWMDKLNSVIENINTTSARDRVCAYLRKMQTEQHQSLIHLTGKKHEVALMLGLRPETFSRTLAELETEGLIKLNHKQIQIIDSTKI
ncbi:MAG: Crp/Fnr family transcriptional regulator [Pseudobdellovibrionaceae bacterium]